MLRSLYSAISGLRNHQTRMDVIGNNISNVNTTGFKRSRVTFSTMLSQTMKGASAPEDNKGGTNPMQIGLGSSVASIDQIMTPGSSQSTGKETDMMIQGSGFFVLNNNGDIVYTRAGAFSFDANGYLIDPATGAKVLGHMWDADDTTPAEFATVSEIRFSLKDELPQEDKIKLPDLPADGKYPSNGWLDEKTFRHPSLVGSYVDLSELGLTPPIDASFDSGTGTITFADNDEAERAIKSTTPITTKKSENIKLPEIPASLPGSGWKDDKTYVNSAWIGATIDKVPDGGTFDSKTGTLSFKTKPDADAAADAAADALNLTWHPPTLSSYSIDQKGAITGVYSNGITSVTHKIAQVAIAQFKNDAGLTSLGNNFYAESSNSGTASLGSAGDDGRGTVIPSAVEMSNVDLSQEFTDMIVTQRGFQANSRVITVSDTLLQELIDLKR